MTAVIHLFLETFGQCPCTLFSFPSSITCMSGLILWWLLRCQYVPVFHLFCSDTCGHISITYVPTVIVCLCVYKVRFSCLIPAWYLFSVICVIHIVDNHVLHLIDEIRPSISTYVVDISAYQCFTHNILGISQFCFQLLTKIILCSLLVNMHLPLKKKKFMRKYCGNKFEFVITIFEIYIRYFFTYK